MNPPVGRHESWLERRRRRRIERLELRYADESEVRRELRIILSPFARRLTVALLGIVAVVAAAFYVVIDANRRQDEQTLNQAVAACERGNLTRDQINLGNDALEAVARAVEANRAALEANSRQAANVPEGVVLTPAQQARLDAFLATLDAGNAQVIELLAAADAAIAAARLPQRDCRPEVVLDNPSATIPATSPETTPPDG